MLHGQLWETTAMMGWFSDGLQLDKRNPLAAVQHLIPCHKNVRDLYTPLFHLVSSHP